MESKNNKLSSKSVKIIIAVFIAALLLAGSMDLWGDKILPAFAQPKQQSESFLVKIRNKRIDSILASIKKEENSIYSDEDIESAVLTVKENFKSRDEYASLAKITFDEEECNKIRDNASCKENYEDKNIIVLLCDYNVYKDFAAYSKGYYSSWQMFLVRSDESSPWEIIDQGYA